MNWNITNVEKENNNDYDVINIIGFSPDYNNKFLGLNEIHQLI